MCGLQKVWHRLLSEHSVPMVIHHIGGWVLTIEVSTHADMGDMNMHCTAIFGKARQEAVYASYWHFSLNFLYMSLDLQYDVISWEPNAQKGLYFILGCCIYTHWKQARYPASLYFWAAWTLNLAAISSGLPGKKGSWQSVREVTSCWLFS